MRAVVCRELGPPDQLVLDDLPEPEAGPGQVLVDVRAAGLNYPDLLIIQGLYQLRPDLPFVPGAEAAGVVAEVGDGVTHVAPGDRVAVTPPVGAFAEKVAAPATHVMPIPPSLSFEQAAGFSIAYGTSYHALKQRAGLRRGETLLVLGAGGGVGSTAVELGKAMGATVIAAASSSEKLAYAESKGADLVLNYAEEDLKTRVREMTGGRGADVVYDPVGGDYSEPAVRATGWNGRFLVIGFASGDIPSIPLNLPLLKGVSIVGVFWGSWATRDPEASHENFRELFEMVEDGRIEPEATEVYDLADYQDAFRAISERRARGKLVLTP